MTFIILQLKKFHKEFLKIRMLMKLNFKKSNKAKIIITKLKFKIYKKFEL